MIEERYQPKEARRGRELSEEPDTIKAIKAMHTLIRHKINFRFNVFIIISI